jgi:hypothetical protein
MSVFSSVLLRYNKKPNLTNKKHSLTKKPTTTIFPHNKHFYNQEHRVKIKNIIVWVWMGWDRIGKVYKDKNQ